MNTINITTYYVTCRLDCMHIYIMYGFWAGIGDVMRYMFVEEHMQKVQRYHFVVLGPAGLRRQLKKIKTKKKLKVPLDS